MNECIYLVDKPVGFSSFQIVQIFKRYHRKVGHGGTLDPFASGLLLIMVGDATKRFTEIQELEKEYCGEIAFGIESDTYDISGQLAPHKDLHSGFTSEQLNDVTRKFVGEVEQVPPPFSAIKLGGRKLYELSRKGTKVYPKSRKVHIKELSITYCEWPFAQFHTVVGKGTYLRALAHDMGGHLGCGAILTSLRRLRVGQYHVRKALTLGKVFSSFGGE